MVTVGDIRKAIEGLLDSAEVYIDLEGNWVALDAIDARQVAGSSLVMAVEKTDGWPGDDEDEQEFEAGMNQDDDEEDDDPIEPEEGDLVTDDYRKFWECGSGRIAPAVWVPFDEDWRPHVKAYMDQEQFWPNVWSLSDHGNYCLISLEDDS